MKGIRQLWFVAMFIPAFTIAMVEAQESTKPQTYIETLPGDVKLEMVAIPGGEFMMGSKPLDGSQQKLPDFVGSSSPIHKVTLKPFYMGRFEVTQAQWKAVMGDNPSMYQGDGLPVERVSWNDAQEFCRKLSQMTGKEYRLPSEAEWEYAARSGSTSDFFFGNNGNQLKEHAWHKENSDGKTHPVGQKKPNAWGLYDVHGNVFEWCEDVWHDNYNGAPTDGLAWVTGGDQNRRIVRGGSWYGLSDSNEYEYHTAFRASPPIPASAANIPFIGFRVVGGSRPTSTVATAQPSALQPDQMVYNRANRTTDPKLKIQAMEKFITDFPRSSMTGAAHQSIAVTLIKNMPDQTERIIRHANLAIEAANKSTREALLKQVDMVSDLAMVMANAGVLLDEAERLVTRGAVSTEEEQRADLLQSRTSKQSVMALIHLRKGKIKEVEKAFQSAYNKPPISDANQPAFLATALGLAENYEKAGKYGKALDYLSLAVLSTRGKVDAKLRQRLETAYRKSHDDSIDGLAELLDAEYERLYPHPVKTEPYQSTKARTSRAVLAEVFTGAGCPPCVAADLSFDAFLERYSRQDLIVLMYHLHIPAPDPMTNPSTQARMKYYPLKGVPSYSIDGDFDVGGGSRSQTPNIYNRLLPKIEKQLENQPGAEIQVNATANGSVITVTANVAGLNKGVDKPRLHIALVEEKLRYSGENGIRFHPMVVRNMAGFFGSGIVLDAAKPGPVEWRFDIEAITEANKKHLDNFEEGRKADNFTFSEKMHVIDPSRLSIVVFVQDDKTKQVLQSALTRIRSVQTASNR